MNEGDYAARAADAASIGIVLINEQGWIVFVNASAELLMGRSRKKLVGKHLDKTGPVGEAACELALRAIEGSRDVFAHDLPVQLGEDMLRLSIDVSPEGEGACICLRRWPKNGARPSSDAAANAAVGFGRMLSHELKNPLAGARGAAQLIAMNDDEETTQLAQLIMNELDRARRISDRWSSVGDISPAPFESVNLHELVREAVQSARTSGVTTDGTSKIEWRESFDPSIPDALADRDLILQAVLNLAINAAEAIGEQTGTITISTCYRTLRAGSIAPDARLEIRVEDNGPGIPDPLREAIFNPFVTSKPAGEGLGLALVTRIADLHGGGLEYESRPGQTVFHLYLKDAAL